MLFLKVSKPGSEITSNSKVFLCIILLHCDLFYRFCNPPCKPRRFEFLPTLFQWVIISDIARILVEGRHNRRYTELFSSYIHFVVISAV